MANGHIKVELITDIEKDTATGTGSANQATFAALPPSEHKLFTTRFAAVFTPNPTAVKDLAGLQGRPWFDAKVKAQVGVFPLTNDIRKWLDLAVGQYNDQVTGGPTLLVEGDPPTCIRYVIVNGVLRIIYNYSLSVKKASAEQHAVPEEYREHNTHGNPQIFASFHIMLTYTGPERAALLDPDPDLDASGPTDPIA